MLRHAGVAQLVEPLISIQTVACSIQVTRSTWGIVPSGKGGTL